MLLLNETDNTDNMVMLNDSFPRFKLEDGYRKVRKSPVSASTVELKQNNICRSLHLVKDVPKCAQDSPLDLSCRGGNECSAEVKSEVKMEDDGTNETISGCPTEDRKSFKKSLIDRYCKYKMLASHIFSISLHHNNILPL